MPTLSARSLVLHHLHVAPASRSRVIPDVRLVGCGSRNLARLVHRDEKASDLQADMARHLIKVVSDSGGWPQRQQMRNATSGCIFVGEGPNYGCLGACVLSTTAQQSGLAPMLFYRWRSSTTVADLLLTL